MILQTDPNLRVLEHNERIHKKAKCYGKTITGETEWCNPGSLTGKKYKRHSISSPSIIMVEVRRSRNRCVIKKRPKHKSIFQTN